MTPQKKRPFKRRIWRWAKRLGLLLVLVFVLVNWVVYNHAYRFTHFDESLQGQRPQQQINEMAERSLWQKMGPIFRGIAVPKSMNLRQPKLPYETIWLTAESDSLEGWYFPQQATRPKACILMAHGYGACKSHMLAQANWWLQQGYSVFALDFRGHGGSSGNQCTIGFQESEDLMQAIRWIEQKDLPIIIYAISMGAAASLKAAAEHSGQWPVKALILECPFASLRQAVVNRMEILGIPSFLLADMMVFWGGQQSGFWAFDHKPTAYAKKIQEPVLLFYGLQDTRVKSWEVEKIYEALTHKKQLVTFPNSGHNNLFHHNKEIWTTTVEEFLQEHTK